MSLNPQTISGQWASPSVYDEDDSLEGSLGRDNFLMVVPPPGPNQTQQLTQLFARLHDSLYARWRGNHLGEGVNPDWNYDLISGKLADSDHWDALAPYGDVGAKKLMDFAFFTPNLSTLRGMVGKQPLDWAINCLSPEVYIRKQEEVSRKGAEGFMREAANRLHQQGMDLRSVMVDPSEVVPDSVDKLESMLTDKEQLEEVLFDMMHANLLHDKTKMKLDNTFKDRCTVNFQAGEVYPESGWVRFKTYRRSQLAWWGPADLETAEDASAWMVTNVLSLPKAVEKYGVYMQKAGTIAEFHKIMNRVARAQPVMNTYKDGTLTETLDGNYPTQTALGTPLGYDRYYQTGRVAQVLEQKIYAKLIEFCKVRLTLDGLNLTAEQREQFDKGILPDGELVIYKNIDEIEYRENRGDPSVKAIPRVRLYESVRLGDRIQVYHRPTASEFRTKNDPVNVRFPIVVRAAEEASLVTLGTPLHELYTNVMMAIRQRVSLSGMKALTYDVSEMPEGWDLQRVMFEAKESGLIVFNGQRLSGGPTKESYRHLQTVDLSLNSDIVEMLNLATALRSLFDELCGVTAGLKGQFQSREALGQTQLSLTQGSLMTFKMAADHEAFVEEVLERMMKLGQKLWARDERRTVALGRDKVKTLQLSRELDLWDYGMFVTSSTKNAEDRQTILQVANQALSSGAMGLKDLLKLLRADNPFRMLDIIETGLDSFERQQVQAQQASAQAQQSAAEANLKKVDVPVQVAEVTGKWRLEVERARQQFAGDREKQGIRFQEDQTDINNAAMLQNQAMQQAGQQQLVQMQQEDPAAAADPAYAPPAGVMEPA